MVYLSDFGAWYVQVDGVEYKFDHEPDADTIAATVAAYELAQETVIQVEAEDGTPI
jgi:hypothetical protein